MGRNSRRRSRDIDDWRPKEVAAARDSGSYSDQEDDPAGQQAWSRAAGEFGAPIGDYATTNSSRSSKDHVGRPPAKDLELKREARDELVMLRRKGVKVERRAENDHQR